MTQVNPYQPSQFAAAPAVSQSRGFDPDLMNTRRGLMTFYYGIVAILAGSILGAIGVGVSAAAGISAVAIIVTLLMLVAIFGGFIAAFVGQFMCISVPERTGAKSMAVAAAICSAFNLLLSVAGFLYGVIMGVQAQGQGPGAGAGGGELVTGGLNGLSSLASLVGFITFTLFLKKLNQYLGREDLAKSARTVLILLCVMFAMVILFIVMAAVGGIMAQGAGPANGSILVVIGVFGLILMIVALITLLKYLNLSIYTAKAIPTA